MNRLFLFSLIILFIVNGCKDNNNSVIPIPEPTEFRQAFFPLAVGNTWNYTDSLFLGDSVSVETYTLSVSSFRKENEKVWWQLEKRYALWTQHIEFTERNDSLFILESNFGNPVSSLEYIPPSVSDTLVFFSLFGGDVVLQKFVWQNGPYIVPAGTFDSCAVFFSRVTPDGLTEVLKPKVGIIQKDIQDSFYPFRRKTILTDYHLME